MNELEFMDIDGPEFLSSVNNEIASIRANLGSDRSYYDLKETPLENHNGLEIYNEICVLDTNFLISKLGYLDTVLNLAEQRPGSLLVILPWVVIRELDGLKSAGHVENSICTRARRAMRFIEQRLREKCISLRGQKMNQILDPAMSQTQNIKGDDRILDCCMYFHQITGKKVTLLSNDRNLCIKVMVHDVESISAESVPKMEALLNRIGGIKSTAIKRPLSPIQPNEDYVMEIDEFYPPNNEEEDYDMMIDDDEDYVKPVKPVKPVKSVKPVKPANNLLTSDKPFKGTDKSRWAHKYIIKRQPKMLDPPAYLDNDPTLVAPKRPPRNLSYSDSNFQSIKEDGSWTSIYSPR